MRVVVCVDSMEPTEKPFTPLEVVEVVAGASVPYHSCALLCAHRRFCSGFDQGCGYIVDLTV
jgi:hypothetical protein